ncbi:MAG: TetR family transcriptional regulator [Myxococcaceae bacterium]|nr:TetR family transcriptional regulator [Myxococcaceae bacterium]
MRRPTALLIAWLLAAGTPAWAATGIDAARAAAVAARQKVSVIRSRQNFLRAELDRVAQKIEALKTQQQGALITDPELDAQLRRSQELSGTLTETAQQLAQAESDLERENLALLQLLNAELASVRAQWDQAHDRAERAKVIERMRTLRDERDQVRAQLPAAKVPALGGARSDDPEELIEQADALRDSEDKVRQRMAALQARINELRDERELERRMNDFLGDESMFDDTDRRLRQTKAQELQKGSSGGLFGMPDSFEAAPNNPASQGPDFSNGTGAGSTESRSDVGPRGAADPRPPPINITSVVKGADARPQLGNADALLRLDPDTNDLEALQAQLQQLETLASDLDRKADDLERRARDAD